MVEYEAAHAIVNLHHRKVGGFGYAIFILERLCSSPKLGFRFAAVRTLSKVAIFKILFKRMVFRFQGFKIGNIII